MKKYGKMIGFYLAILLIIIAVVSFLNPMESNVAELSYSQLITELGNQNVAEMEIDGEKATGKLKDGKEFETVVPEMVIETQLSEYIKANPNLKVEIAKDTSMWISLIPTFIMVGLLVVFFILMTKQTGGGMGVMGFAKSHAKISDGKNKKVTFDDVAGADEEKEELVEIVDFLKSPDAYSKLGARIPKGVLLVGPPGTGKTLLAKAVAGEAGVPFFSISGSDFVEMFVGVGASRVRDLFENAKKNSPCIIFIDEIDAVGRHRGAGLGGGHDEREQTLNQLLVEMDGFGANEGIIIIAATNRPDILDPALLRPGRFDRQILVNVPDVKGRRDILDVHKKGKPLGKSVDLDVIAKGTPGFTGADLENLMNEAALLTARRKGKVITMKELEEAIKRVIAGPEKRSKVIEKSDQIITAYHEAGHAIVMEYLHNGEEVHEISIVPRGMAAGYTISLPSDDSQHMSKGKLLDQIAGLLGGRAAEKIALDDICTGASNDIERATSIARKMVTEWGMSERLGPMTFGHDDGEVFLGKDIGRSRNYSEEVAAIIDEEIRAIVESAFERACDILREKKAQLIEVSETLLKVERLSGDDFRKIYYKEEQEENASDNEASESEMKTQNSGFSFGKMDVKQEGGIAGKKPELQSKKPSAEVKQAFQISDFGEDFDVIESVNIIENKAVTQDEDFFPEEIKREEADFEREVSSIIVSEEILNIMPRTVSDNPDDFFDVDIIPDEQGVSEVFFEPVTAEKSEAMFEEEECDETDASEEQEIMFETEEIVENEELEEEEALTECEEIIELDEADGDEEVPATDENESAEEVESEKIDEPASTVETEVPKEAEQVEMFETEEPIEDEEPEEEEALTEFEEIIEHDEADGDEEILATDENESVEEVESEKIIEPESTVETEAPKEAEQVVKKTVERTPLDYENDLKAKARRAKKMRRQYGGIKKIEESKFENNDNNKDNIEVVSLPSDNDVFFRKISKKNDDE